MPAPALLRRALGLVLVLPVLVAMATRARAQCTLIEAQGTLVQSGACVLFQPQFTNVRYELEHYAAFQPNDCVGIVGLLEPGSTAACPQAAGFVRQNQIFVGCIPGPPPGLTFCAGDGLDPLVTTPCPCGNLGAPGNGCANSATVLGASLLYFGSIQADAVVLAASGMPASSGVIYLKGNVIQVQAVPFGDGLRCVDGTLVRLGYRPSVNGCSHYPDPGEPTLSARGGTPLGSGLIAGYQAYYRNAAPFCTSETFNATNAVQIVW